MRAELVAMLANLRQLEAKRSALFHSLPLLELDKSRELQQLDQDINVARQILIFRFQLHLDITEQELKEAVEP